MEDRNARETLNGIKDLLNEIASQNVVHKSVAGFQLTPFDAYAEFLERASQEFTPEEIRTLKQGSSKERIDQILTPNLVCVLALEQLHKTLP